MHLHDIEEDFSVAPAPVEAILEAHPDICLLFVTHYLGVPQPHIESLSELCQRRRLLLMEDCAHALFSQHRGRPLGSFGDYAIFSARKSLPMSEGGVLICAQPLQNQDTKLNEPAGLSRLGRVAYSMQQGARTGKREGVARLLAPLTILAWTFPSLISKLARASSLWSDSQWLTPEVEGAAAVPVYGQGISTGSQRLLVSADAAEVQMRRRSKHTQWVQLLASIDGARAVNEILPEGACPLNLAVIVADPATCVQRLADMGIEAFNWWQFLVSAIHWPDFPVARHYKQSIVALPLVSQI